VTPDEVRKLADETYGKVARRAEPGPRVRPEAQHLRGALEVSLSDERVKQPSLRQAWVVPSYTSAAREDAEKGPRVAASLDVLSEILGGGSTSRLYRELVIDRQVATSAGGWYQGNALDPSQFMLYAVPADGVAMEDVGKATLEVVADIARDGVSDEELERARRSLLAGALYAQDNQASLARIFGVALTTGATVESVQAWPALIASITADDVREAAASYLADAPVTAYLRPQEGTSDDPVDAAGAPAVQPMSDTVTR
jgi:zinc protease